MHPKKEPEKEKQQSRQRSATALEDKETPVLKTQTDRICRIFTGTDVFFHGTYDVGLAAAGMV